MSKQRTQSSLTKWYIFNFSKRLITDQEKSILPNGLNFSIPPKKLDYCDFLAPCVLLHHKLNEEPISPSSGFYSDFVKTKLKDILLGELKSYHHHSFVLSEEELKVLNGLKDDQDIVVVKRDKDNGVVILDKIDYNKKMEEILQDSSKFKCLSDDPHFSVKTKLGISYEKLSRTGS